MLGAPSRRTPTVRLAAAVVALALAAACPAPSSAQNPGDQPTLPTTPDNPAPSGSEANPALPPYAPSNTAGSGLLPANPPLPPHPSVPNPYQLLPDSTPPPAATPFPLPATPQTGTPGSPATPGTPGAPGTTPLTGITPATGGGGASTTNVTDAARRFQYAFRLSTGVTYDDNVFLTSNADTPGVKSTRRGISKQDVYFVVDPSVSLGFGDFLTRVTNYVEFDYTADALIYTRNTDQTTVQHLFNLQGAYHFAQITLSLSQGVQLLNSTDLTSNAGSLYTGTANDTTSSPNTAVNLDASRRTSVNIYTTRLDANYGISDKTSIDLDGYFSASDYSTLISSESLSGDVFFNYSPTGKITLGLGVTVGYTIQDDPAPNEFYQQVNLRLSYTATTKLSVSGSLGIETREISGAGGVSVTPVFDLAVTYSPIDSTSLVLSASRRVATSAVLTGENFDTTGFSFSVSQRFFQRANARLSVGYTYSSYDYTGRGGGDVNRTEDYYFVQPSLDYSIRDNITASIFYVRRQAFSSLANDGFSDNQVGARLLLSF